MNEIVRPSDFLPTTQAAEGLPRRRWTVAEIDAMTRMGIFREGERFELIGGEIVPMSPKGNSHEVVKQELQEHWFPLIKGTEIKLITETTLRTNDDGMFEPDFLFWPRKVPLAKINMRNILLLVEVADSSLSYDRGRKARIYSILGLREYWVIDAVRLRTTIYRKPSDEGYQYDEELGPSDELKPRLLPALAVTLSELSLEPIADE